MVRVRKLSNILSNTRHRWGKWSCQHYFNGRFLLNGSHQSFICWICVIFSFPDSLSISAVIFSQCFRFRRPVCFQKKGWFCGLYVLTCFTNLLINVEINREQWIRNGEYVITKVLVITGVLFQDPDSYLYNRVYTVWEGKKALLYCIPGYFHLFDGRVLHNTQKYFSKKKRGIALIETHSHPEIAGEPISRYTSWSVWKANIGLCTFDQSINGLNSLDWCFECNINIYKKYL